MNKDGVNLHHSDVTHLGTALKDLQSNKLLCDIVIHFTFNDSLTAHSCVLAACSPVLKQCILQQNATEDRFIDIDNMGIPYKIWNYLLEFMYTSQVYISSEEIGCLDDLVSGASKLNLKDLQEVADEYRTVVNLLDEDEHMSYQDEEADEDQDEDHDEDQDEGTDDDGVLSTFDNELCELSEDKGSKSCNKSDTTKVKVVKIDKFAKSETNTFKCSKCDKYFASVTRQKLHERSHSRNSKYHCSKCSFEGTFMEMREHSKTTHKEIERCPVGGCDFQSDNSNLIGNHVRKEHSDIEMPWKCSKCPFKAAKKSSLSMHFACHRTKMFACPVCDKRFSRFRDCKRHEAIHSDTYAFPCPECDKGFNREHYLNDHMRRHHNMGTLPCPLCSAEFPTYDSLYRHRVTVHEQRSLKDKNYKCERCKKSFYRPSYLKIHMRSHTGERPFTCMICSKSFASNSALKLHQTVHSDEQMYLCAFCPYSTNRSGNLKKHELNHSKIKKKKCKLCEIEFTNVDDYRKHREEKHSKPKKVKVKSEILNETHICKTEGTTKQTNIEELSCKGTTEIVKLEVPDNGKEIAKVVKLEIPDDLDKPIEEIVSLPKISKDNALNCTQVNSRSLLKSNNVKDHVSLFTDESSNDQEQKLSMGKRATKPAVVTQVSASKIITLQQYMAMTNKPTKVTKIVKSTIQPSQLSSLALLSGENTSNTSNLNQTVQISSDLLTGIPFMPILPQDGNTSITQGVITSDVAQTTQQLIVPQTLKIVNGILHTS